MLGLNVTDARLLHTLRAPAAFQLYNPSLVEVARDGATGRPKGYGFVHFRSWDDTEAAAAEMKDARVQGRRIYFKQALAKEDLRAWRADAGEANSQPAHLTK
jgi:RNA recognition motif-containing protein